MKTDEKQPKFICAKCCGNVLISASEADEMDELRRRVTALEEAVELLRDSADDEGYKEFLGFDIYGNPN